jgi:SAM-dependent methyltransferase
VNEARVWDRLADDYASRWALDPPERELLARLRSMWPHVDMLDLGVGAGRTAYTFAALTRSYVGVDISPMMVERARLAVGEDERTRFLVGDARDLSAFHGRGFDLVLFSFNGLDAVGHEDRLRILREVRHVIADDGLFGFSSHSLLALPFRVALRRPSLRDPVRSTARSLRRAIGLARANRRLDLPAAWRAGWTLVRDEAHDFSLVLYYVHPETQVAQLADAGFGSVQVLDMRGRPVGADAPGPDPHLFYLSRPVPVSA